MATKALEATLRFLPRSEGGRSAPAMSGIRSSLRLGEIFTSCVVHVHGKTEELEFGVDYEVTIEILFWDDYGHLFCENAPIELFEGNRLVARGRWRV
jgi:hypothetical protein